MSVEPMKLREAVATAEVLLDRKLSLGEVAMVERLTKAGVTVEDLMRIVDRPVEGPEPVEETHRYEAQGNGAAKIPEATE